MNSYHSLIRYLHMGLIGLIALQFLLGWVMPEFGHVQSVSTLANLHFSFGLVELVVAVVLIVARLTFGRPPRVEAPPLQTLAAEVVHFVLYVLVILVPITGYAWVSAHGLTANLFTFIPLPLLPASAFLRSFGELHSFLTTVLGVLVLGHAGAALYHHFVFRDPTLTRMFRDS